MNWGLELPPAYYRDDNVYLINGDCREVLAAIPDKSVALVLTDPPYLIPAKSCGFDSGRVFIDRIHADGIGEGFDFNLLDMFEAKLKTINMISFCNKYQFSGYLSWIEAREYSWQLLTWHKTGCIPLRNHYLPDTEYIFHIWKSLAIRDERHKKTYFIHNVNRSGFDHPTVKPESIVSKLILGASDKGQVILDPFLGSGTTAYCAKKLGRRCIGIEISEKYCELAAHRCSQSFMDLSVTDSGKKCYVCGGAITGKRTDSGYCSNACKQKAYRNRRNVCVTDKQAVKA